MSNDAHLLVSEIPNTTAKVEIRDVACIRRSHTVKADCTTGIATVQVIADRISFRISYLYSMGTMVKGVTVTDAKNVYFRICGQIDLLNAVAECETLQQQLRDDLECAYSTALARLRK
jgi:hypothetical protein